MDSIFLIEERVDGWRYVESHLRFQDALSTAAVLADHNGRAHRVVEFQRHERGMRASVPAKRCGECDECAAGVTCRDFPITTEGAA